MQKTITKTALVLAPEDLEEIRKIKIEDQGLVGMIDELVGAVARRKGKILTDRRNWWDKIYLKYKLDPGKDYIVDQRTGNLVRSKPKKDVVN